MPADAPKFAVTMGSACMHAEVEARGAQHSDPKIRRRQACRVRIPLFTWPLRQPKRACSKQRPRVKRRLYIPSPSEAGRIEYEVGRDKIFTAMRWWLAAAEKGPSRGKVKCAAGKQPTQARIYAWRGFFFRAVLPIFVLLPLQLSPRAYTSSGSPKTVAGKVSGVFSLRKRGISVAGGHLSGGYSL